MGAADLADAFQSLAIYQSASTPIDHVAQGVCSPDPWPGQPPQAPVSDHTLLMSSKYHDRADYSLGALPLFARLAGLFVGLATEVVLEHPCGVVVLLFLDDFFQLTLVGLCTAGRLDLVARLELAVVFESGRVAGLISTPDRHLVTARLLTLQLHLPCFASYSSHISGSSDHDSGIDPDSLAFLALQTHSNFVLKPLSSKIMLISTSALSWHSHAPFLESRNSPDGHWHVSPVPGPVPLLQLQDGTTTELVLGDRSDLGSMATWATAARGRTMRASDDRRVKARMSNSSSRV